MLRRDLVRRWASPEMMSFLAVGGAGFVVDVGAFNLLRSVPLVAAHDPALAKTVAVCLAMAVTYVGNSAFTWRDVAASHRHREILLFVLFNTIGLGFSIVTLFVSRHLLGLTSGVADNISANVVGIGLGTAFRFWSYRRFVFTERSSILALARPEQ
ncbi:MAG: GtrA family protein [Aeromicrobium sp.]|jgi:putative flippase GtrA|nr:GtrA family protein [Aeromicrobium sp.]